MLVDFFHKVMERCDEIRKLRYSIFNPLEGADKLLQVGTGCRKFHIQQTIQASRVVPYTVFGNHSAAPADDFREQYALRGMQLDIVLTAKAEHILHRAQESGNGFVVEENIIQLRQQLRP